MIQLHTAEDHLHTDIACNIEERQQNYRLGTVSKRLPHIRHCRGEYGWVDRLLLMVFYEVMFSDQACGGSMLCIF